MALKFRPQIILDVFPSKDSSLVATVNLTGATVLEITCDDWEPGIAIVAAYRQPRARRVIYQIHDTRKPNASRTRWILADVPTLRLFEERFGLELSAEIATATAETQNE